MSERIDILLALYSDAGAYQRFQGEGEHLYTAATVAAAGALAWGVASVANRSVAQVCAPAAILAILALAVAVCFKIKNNNHNYRQAALFRERLLDQMGEEFTPANKAVVTAFLNVPARGGHRGSMQVVVIAAFGAILFCLALLVPR